MTKYDHTARLQGNRGEEVVLQSVDVAVAFASLLSDTTLRQVYRNLEDVAIEAVYTFPLASSAVLLGLTVTIGERVLQGRVVEKSQAEERYEEAITDGDTAIMLEQIESGMYTMNVGNIQPGEEVAIAIRYGELLSWQDDTIRFLLPTTIAPRYGNPEEAGLAPHQTPEHSLLAENLFQLKISLTGALAQARLDCPSHRVVITEAEEATVVTLAGGLACMDRDFVLNIHQPQGGRDLAVLGEDISGGYVGLASFVPQLPAPEDIPGRSVKIVVDCSGSMNGDSINQAREALYEIIDRLRPADYFNLIAFGSRYTCYFERQVVANKENLSTVRRLLRGLQADMGGTEMARALEAAVNLPGPDMPQDILLITDGEIWQSKALLKMINHAQHRVFAVGVGSAVAEGFLRDLARETGGCCELVVPGEEMREKIVRHFKRIYLPRAEKVEVKWPEAPLENIPTELGPVYDGDTLHVFGRFSTKPRGSVSLTIAMADGRSFSQSITLEENSQADENLLARMAIARSLTRRDPAEAAALAVRYQLISPWSNYLVVDVLDDAAKSDQLPTLRKVPQMLAAGWGGSSLVSSAPSYARVSRQASTDMLYQESYSITKSYRINESILWGLDTPLVFIDKCVAILGNNLELPLKITGYADLTACGLPEGAVKVLQAFAKSVTPEVNEETVVTVFLWALAKTQMGAGFGRDVIRLLTKAKKKQQPDPKLVVLIVDAVAEVTPHTWGSHFPESSIPGKSAKRM